MIISSLQSDQAPKFERLNDASRLHIIPNMTFTSLGMLTKWTFAAKFNHDGVADSWPELQIWRRESENRYTKNNGSSMEPRHTGYLNVFEYDLTENAIEVRAGDVFGIYQPASGAQYLFEFLAVNDDYMAPTNYIMHGVDPSMEEFNILDVQEERPLHPLVFAQITGITE